MRPEPDGVVAVTALQRIHNLQGFHRLFLRAEALHSRVIKLLIMSVSCITSAGCACCLRTSLSKQLLAASHLQTL